MTYEGVTNGACYHATNTEFIGVQVAIASKPKTVCALLHVSILDVRPFSGKP